MKSTTIFLFILVITSSIGLSVTHTIGNSGTTFVPSSITINLGDTVKFVIESIHNAVEVSEATWNANQATSNGGFTVPFGGGTVVLTQAKKYYYVCQPHAEFGMKGTITVTQITDVKNLEGKEPNEFALMQNYPNPFNPETEIRFTIQDAGFTSLKVYDVIGREVTTLVDKNMSPGEYSVTWNAANKPSGMYFYQLKSAGIDKTRRMILVR